MKTKNRLMKVALAILCIMALLLPTLPGQFVVQAASRTITVNPDQVINTDFAGVGLNIIPTALMENNLSKGYNDTYWEMDQKRLIMMKPKIARLWFQVDWMETTKGTYTWNSPKMLAFYKYLDALKAAGTEVEFNFSWKVGSDIQSWFSIPGTTGRISAPNDLDAFATSCSAVLNELINVRGYNNIKYLTFYNEPNGYWDFHALSDEKAYYADMVQKVHDKLLADGRRSLVKIWGPEEWNAIDWTKYMKDNKSGIFDGYTFHTYGVTYTSLLNEITTRTSYVAPIPVYMTEFGWSEEEDSNWLAGYANSIIAGANNGLSGLAVWQYNGVWCEDPDEGVNTNGAYTLSDSLPTTIYPKLPYYQVSMLARYIPAHSTVVSATTADSDIRTAAFKTADGNYTIIVECREGDAKNLTVNFNGVNIGKTFSKHVYTDTVTKEANALIPSRTGTFTAGTSFTDNSIPSDYCVIVYTTLPDQTQVEVTAAANIDKDQPVQLSANVIDNTAGVTWSVVNGGGTVSSTGLYTPASNAEYGDMAAVKATSTADPSAYGISLITISTDPVETPPVMQPKPTPLPTGDTLFSDDFSNGLSKWTNTGNCSVTDGALLVTSNETIQNTDGGEQWQNYSIEADVKVTAGAAGIVFRKVDNNNLYMWQFNASDQQLRPHKRVNGGWGVIKTKACDIAIGEWFHFRIDVNGDTYTTFVNGKFVDQYKDTQFLSGNLDHGKIGFRQSGETALIDNIVVKEITDGSPVPTTPPPVDPVTSGPEGYTYLGQEDDTVTLPGLCDVAFGAGGNFRYLYGVSGTITLTLETFGGDPAPNQVKYGYYKLSGSTPTPTVTPTPTTTPTPTVTPTPTPEGPEGYTLCASEGQTVTLPGICDVAYGANGSYYYLYGKSGSITFNNAAFGGDPCPNITKKGYYKLSGSTPTPTPTEAPSPTQAPVILLQDDFSSDLNKWENTGNCNITDGVLVNSNVETMQSVSGGPQWTDYTIEADVKITSSAAGIIFRKADGDNMYMWQLSNTYGGLRPHKKVNGSWSTIKSVPYTFNLNTWYQVKIEASGSTIKTYINGNLLDTTTDTQFSSGKVGFRESGESAQFDNLKVY